MAYSDVGSLSVDVPHEVLLAHENELGAARDVLFTDGEARLDPL